MNKMDKVSYALGLSIGNNFQNSGISNINASEAANEGATFNLLGQKVASNAKGLVIKNGKKFINK